MEDLTLLIEHFLEHYNTENQKQVKRFSSTALERLLAYPWPGNVRELENVVERGVVLARRDEITPDLLPSELQRPVRQPTATGLPAGVDFNAAMSRYERQLIQSALKAAGGVQKQAAEILGLKPTTLNEKIKRLKLGPGRP